MRLRFPNSSPLPSQDLCKLRNLTHRVSIRTGSHDSIVPLFEATLNDGERRRRKEKAYSGGNPDAGLREAPALHSRNFYDVSGGRGLSQTGKTGLQGGAKPFLIWRALLGFPSDLYKSFYACYTLAHSLLCLTYLNLSRTNVDLKGLHSSLHA